jgi:hypothetical protein
MPASGRLRYVKKQKQEVIAVKLDLDTKGFTYQKWGGRQKCKQGDWIVDNNGDVYTVDAKTFDRTYKKSKRNTYIKVAPVWAVQTDKPGVVKTKEGATKYEAGHFLVSNEKSGGDSYAVSPEKFKAMYKRTRS